LQREEDRGELVAALGWDLDFLDRNDVELGLNLKVAAHINQYASNPDNLQNLSDFPANVCTSVRLFAESPLPSVLRSLGIWAASP